MYNMCTGGEVCHLCLSCYTFVGIMWFVCSCCEELKLHKNMDIDVEIQFQMNRLIFSQMHYAIDQLDCIEMLFPDYSKIIRATPSGPVLQPP